MFIFYWLAIGALIIIIDLFAVEKVHKKGIPSELQMFMDNNPIIVGLSLIITAFLWPNLVYNWFEKYINKDL